MNETNHKALLTERGQGMVEFAMVIFLLIFIGIGAIRLGVVLFNYMNMGVSANAGVFQATLGRDEAQVQQVVEAELAAKILSLNKSEAVEFGMSCEPADCGYGATVTVALTKTEQIGLLGFSVPLHVSVSGIVQKEQ